MSDADMGTNFNTSLAYDYDALRRYMGEVRFNALAAGCYETQSSDIRTASSKLPEQIASLPQMPPELSEIATLERALRYAFEAGEETLPDTSTHFKLHSSVTLLTFTQNTVSIWSSLKCGEPPPRPYRLDAPQRVLVWRHNAQPRMRLLGEEEFVSLAALSNPTSTFDENYLCGWLQTEVLTGACAEK
jgi:hypothetical protein